MAFVEQTIPHDNSGVFRQWQPIYAEHGVATFPVNDNKRPAVTNYGKFGLPASRQIASKSVADAFGFMCGRRSGITVLDVDTADERVLADAIDRHGKTPIVARSGSGHFQAWYRHAGERRLIRPRRNVPIDILGGGYVVAPPSRVERGEYRFIQGSLDDLDSLPTLADAPSAIPADVPVDWGQMRDGDGRNNALFRRCLEAARSCDDFEQLLDYARTQNSQFGEPMEDQQVMRSVASAWKYETEGRNYIGGMRAVFSTADIMPLMPDPYVAALMVWAKSRFKPDSHFWIADGLAEKFGWSLYDLRQTRRRAIKMGFIRLITPAGYRRAAIYGYGPRALKCPLRIALKYLRPVAQLIVCLVAGVGYWAVLLLAVAAPCPVLA